VVEGTGAGTCSCSCSRSLKSSSSESPLKHLQILACQRSIIWTKGIWLSSGTDTAGSAAPLASGQTLGTIEGGTPSTEMLTVFPLGDTTSTEVDKGPRIDLVTIFFTAEEEREVDFSRPGLSPISRWRSPSLSLRSFLCLDLGFSQLEPEEPEPTKDSVSSHFTPILFPFLDFWPLWPSKVGQIKSLGTISCTLIRCT
jgi:hypothetical protein